jgi:hypothetical protein
VVRSAPGVFPSLETRPPWLIVPISGDRIDRVWIHLLSWHAKGAGLAEVDVQE